MCPVNIAAGATWPTHRYCQRKRSFQKDLKGERLNVMLYYRSSISSIYERSSLGFRGTRKESRGRLLSNAELSVSGKFWALFPFLLDPHSMRYGKLKIDAMYFLLVVSTLHITSKIGLRPVRSSNRLQCVFSQSVSFERSAAPSGGEIGERAPPTTVVRSGMLQSRPAGLRRRGGPLCAGGTDHESVAAAKTGGGDDSHNFAPHPV